ncbi:MAG: tetrahydrofolate dehydrogenase/cyclohydrolase catalytic domain-containing protein [Candidatus Veblenbacteria bacterium]|nr:tetrahydrofolate dehydrogenase/cyclohydrolase catalytic domain-containing protein [Candidatus Veblenbacteria bacterium]
MAVVVQGREIADSILASLRVRVEAMKQRRFMPLLAVVVVGEDKPSLTYVRKKGEAAEALGMGFLKFEFPATIGRQELIGEIKKIQQEHKLSGLIIQLPVPEALWPFTREIVNNIALAIDVDCLSHPALGRVLMNESVFVPPTPGAILEVLSYYKVPLQGKEVCVVGRGDLIGRPLVGLLSHYPVTLTTCGRATRDLARYTRTADVVITGVGKHNLVTGDMIKPGAAVVDAGVSFYEGKMYGDIEYDTVAERAGLVTPTPGGVGPITVAKLLQNTVQAAERQCEVTPKL